MLTRQSMWLPVFNIQGSNYDDELNNDELNDDGLNDDGLNDDDRRYEV